MKAERQENQRTSMGSLIIHVGPPKTATTSLQIAAECLALNNYIYGGVNQPRSRNGLSLASKLHLACKSNQSRDWGTGEEAAKSIRSKCDRGFTVFVSEEMFMVPSAGIGCEEKMRRLRALLADVSVKLLFTLRRPSDALPSLYQQLHKNLPFDLKMNFSSFCRSEYAKCFDYQFCEEAFHRAGFRKVSALQFDSLKLNRVSIGDILGREHECADVLIPLSWQNKSVTAEKLRLIGKVSLNDFGKAKSPEKIKKKALFNSEKRLSRFIQSHLARIPVRRAALRTLIVPPDVAAHLDQVYVSKVLQYGQPDSTKSYL